MAEPIAFEVTRYRCPTCPRTHSSKALAKRHMARCWHNPEVRGCKTCEHYEGGYDMSPYESCAVGRSLDGSAPCGRCSGAGGDPTSGPCTDCLGSGRVEGLKPGPVVGCPDWAPRDGV